MDATDCPRCLKPIPNPSGIPADERFPCPQCGGWVRWEFTTIIGGVVVWLESCAAPRANKREG
jgi:hypothetical protein